MTRRARAVAVFALAATMTGVLIPACHRHRDTAEEKENLIRVVNPLPGATVTSPLHVAGEARGYWFFEASFPVRLVDANGREIAVAQARAQTDWMTERFVPFEAVLEFEAPDGTSGTLVLEKDNPSGLAEHADHLHVPVRFPR